MPFILAEVGKRELFLWACLSARSEGLRLLLNQPSPRFEGPFYELVWRLYPRQLARMFFPQMGVCSCLSEPENLVSVSARA
jgi:hypothetical protein